MDAWAVASNSVLVALSLALGAVVATRGRANKAAPCFLALCGAATTFGYSRLMLAGATIVEEKLYWTRVGFLCAIALLPVLLEFPDAMLGIRTATNRSRALVWAICAAFAILVFTPWFLTMDDTAQVGHGGPAMAVLWLVFSLVIFRFLVMFWRARWTAPNEVARNRIEYVLAGVLVFGVSAGVDIAHRLGLVVLFPGLIAQYGVLFFLSTSAYAIVRHKLLDIEVALSKGLVYSLTTASVAVFFIVFSEMAATVGERKLGGFGPAPAGFLAGILAALTFEPVRHLVQRIVDYIFFGDLAALERVRCFRRLHTLVLERDQEGLGELQGHLEAIIRECRDD